MNAASNLASRKLFVATVAILVIGLRNKVGLDLSPDDVQGIVSVATAAIFGQAGIDLLAKAMPAITAYLSTFATGGLK